MGSESAEAAEDIESVVRVVRVVDAENVEAQRHRVAAVPWYRGSRTDPEVRCEARRSRRERHVLVVQERQRGKEEGVRVGPFLKQPSRLCLLFETLTAVIGIRAEKFHIR